KQVTVASLVPVEEIHFQKENFFEYRIPFLCKIEKPLNEESIVEFSLSLLSVFNYFVFALYSDVDTTIYEYKGLKSGTGISYSKSKNYSYEKNSQWTSFTLMRQNGTLLK